LPKFAYSTQRQVQDDLLDLDWTEELIMSGRPRAGNARSTNGCCAKQWSDLPTTSRGGSARNRYEAEPNTPMCAEIYMRYVRYVRYLPYLPYLQNGTVEHPSRCVGLIITQTRNG
jgi:hypothetical protein